MGNCKYCKDSCSFKSKTGDDLTFDIDEHRKELIVWDGYECIAIFAISYCPICGEKLW